MFGMISTLAVCATFIWFATKYLQPYKAPEKETMLEIDKDTEREVINLDNVVAELYGRLEEDYND